MSKTALIVDDSPLARHVLGKLLGGYQLTVATAESAEAALEYLKLRRPDVVFMDHQMPGMDGFEALEAIKANPATATIPVMMYTSQEGELYVGQARALGAMGVLPKELKPTQVAQVLQALHLIPESGVRATRPEGATPAAAEEPPHNADVAALLEELFHQQRSALREEIREGYERALATSARLPVMQAPAEQTRKRSVNVAGGVALALLICSLSFALLYFKADRLLDDANARAGAAQQGLAQALSLQTSLSTQNVPATLSDDFVAVLEWAVNLSGSYGFLEVPLNDARAEAIAYLSEFLDRAGFSGIIAMDVSVGRFCMDYGVDGEWHLAQDDRLVSECDRIGWTQIEEESMGRRQSLAFANTVVGGTGTGARIEVQTRSLGAAQPLIAYPIVSDYLTAGEWNAIAALNQRVAVSLISFAGEGVSSPVSTRLGSQ
jgi:CheY-like chemotaxis protein